MTEEQKARIRLAAMDLADAIEAYMDMRYSKTNGMGS